MISVALIEDNRLVREGMTAMLNQTGDFEVVAAGPSGDPALLRDAKPQVILLDVGLWDDDSLRVAETVRKESPESKVIIMDLLPVHEDIVEFVNAGVSGFILKDATFDDLVTTIRSVAEGAHVLPPAMTSSLFSQIAKEAIVRGRAAAMESVRMTTREREVTGLIGEGLSNKEIATEFEISVRTVENHISHILAKKNFDNRVEIARFVLAREKAE